MYTMLFQNNIGILENPKFIITDHECEYEFANGANHIAIICSLFLKVLKFSNPHALARIDARGCDARPSRVRAIRS